MSQRGKHVSVAGFTSEEPNLQVPAEVAFILIVLSGSLVLSSDRLDPVSAPELN